jgi:GT2 family glycosyltransferase
MPEPARDTRCDIVLLTWNHLELAQPCIESILRHATIPARLLIVDNGSEAPARDALRRVAGTPLVSVELLRNETNEGFRKGMTRGWRARRAPYVCLLNNDTLVTRGWLARMLEVADAHPEIGLLNPSSNMFGDRPCPGETIEAHAAHLESRRGEWVEVGSCVGFCLLIKRAVIERIGLLTEDEPGFFFEDDDYSRRAQEAGFLCAGARSAYVHHAEHQSVRHLPQRERVFRASREAYWRRWGRPLRIAYLPSEPVAAGSAQLRTVLDQAVRWVRRGSRVHVYAGGINPPSPGAPPLGGEEDDARVASEGSAPPGVQAGATGKPVRLHGGVSPDELFRSVGRVPHVDVLWCACPTRAQVFWQVLKRQKKRFDLILTSDPAATRWLTRWRWLHRAAVVDPRDVRRLEETWQTASRFPS